MPFTINSFEMINSFEITSSWAPRDAAALSEVGMILNRRDLLRATVAATVLAANRSAIAQTASSDDFSIDTAFADFMRNIGGAPHDGGGSVTFTGHDPIVRSRFRTGACMAIPAMGAGVGAAAVWRERTGQSQDLSVDLRQAVYAVAPWARLVVEELREYGMLPGDPLPAKWTWQPTLNDRRLQAPLAIGNPLSFAIFETRDGRRVPRRGEAGTVSTAIAIRLLFGSVRPRPRLSGLPRPP